MGIKLACVLHVIKVKKTRNTALAFPVGAKKTIKVVINSTSANLEGVASSIKNQCPYGEYERNKAIKTIIKIMFFDLSFKKPLKARNNT